MVCRRDGRLPQKVRFCSWTGRAGHRWHWRHRLLLRKAAGGRRPDGDYPGAPGPGARGHRRREGHLCGAARRACDRPDRAARSGLAGIGPRVWRAHAQPRQEHCCRRALPQRGPRRRSLRRDRANDGRLRGDHAGQSLWPRAARAGAAAAVAPQRARADCRAFELRSLQRTRPGPRARSQQHGRCYAVGAVLTHQGGNVPARARAQQAARGRWRDGRRECRRSGPRRHGCQRAARPGADARARFTRGRAQHACLPRPGGMARRGRRASADACRARGPQEPDVRG
mmetsp:Transcript_34698/g.91278  ORF Transcript_34698/g.91278 Transcript_34698/m.91278 type:complete len:284 (-) Transcript_34698:245-1096(-)